MNTINDTKAPLDIFSKNGYYTVNNAIFNHKIFALQEATRTNSVVSWHFYDDVFSKFKWQQTSELTLDELYKLRALQLRQKYDYLILAFSGGADSTTIFETFVKNNILLDEIIISWPLSQTNGKIATSLSTDASNLISEWELSIKPKLDQIKHSYPNIKITICDYKLSDSIIEDNDDTVTIVQNFSFVSIQKFRAIDKVLEQRSSQYQSVGTIYGISPVDLIKVDGYLAVIFADTAISSPKSDLVNNSWIRNTELFYWTGDLPELVNKQAHIMLQYFRSNPHEQSMLSELTLEKNLTYRQVKAGDYDRYRLLCKFLFYPTWNHNTLQVKKPKELLRFNEWYSWFYNNAESVSILDPWVSTITAHQKLVDQKYLMYNEKNPINYRAFTTKFYIVGKL